MAVRVLWTIEEAVILLDALIQNINGEIDRNTAISNVSDELRKRAIAKGVDIDDVYRNINGITFQMRLMEYVFSGGKHGLQWKKSPKLFQNVVDLYKNDRNRFDKLLMEAKGMPANTSIEEQFAKWLSSKVSPRQLAELWPTFSDVETFCLERKILKKRLFETTNRAIIKAVFDTVNANKVFRSRFKKNINRMRSAVKYYYDFIKELLAAEQPTQKRENELDMAPPPATGTEKCAIEIAVNEAQSNYTVTFSADENLSFTKPSSVTYFEESAKVDNWSQAYVRVVKVMFDDYPEIFKRMLNKNIAGHGRIDFADENNVRYMVAPKIVSENFFVETNLSATDIVSKIRMILTLCNVDHENLVITYTKRKSRLVSALDQPEIKTELQPDRSSEREKFIEWMKESGIASATILSYISAVNQCSKALKEYGITEEELLTVSDTELLIRYRDELLIRTEFKKINERQHNRFRSAFNKLIDYRSTGKQVSQSVALQAPNQGSAIPDSLNFGSTSTDSENERFDAILRESFSEGMLPNALRLDKFRMLHKDKYGEETIQDDDCLFEKLKAAGTFIDGRIYPKQDSKQNNLLSEILTEIINTLNNGARCIYLCCVLEHWRQELANQFRVYNEDTLKALLTSQDVPGLFITNTVLKTTAGRVHPEENIISVMKECHSGMTYQQIQEKLWFIPMDEIKHALVSAPQIANVDNETYFYVPNFPASSAELQHLKMCMRAEIAAKGYLVAQDIARIIHEQCHTIAINTADYKDWAYRNILKYLFRDDFQFGGSVVTEKGESLEMQQIFRNYCREHQRITLDDLNILKDEIGVPIYWEAVQAEMVRVNADELVHRDLIHFDVDATDMMLSKLCPGDYIALKEIGLFLHFPPIEFPWNEFVLEGYLRDSKVFKLYHVSYANHGAFGAMVRTNSKFADYRAIIVDVLAHSKEWKTAQQALELIVDKGYQARKRFTNFEQVTQEASLIRERIEAGRK